MTIPAERDEARPEHTQPCDCIWCRFLTEMAAAKKGHDCPLCGCQTISDATDVVLYDVGAERERQEESFPNQTLPHSPICGTAVGERDASVVLKDARAREARAKEWVRYHLDRDQLTWADVLEEEHAEALAATDIEHLREELIQVAAVAVRWVEAIDRERGAGPVDNARKRMAEDGAA